MRSLIKWALVILAVLMFGVEPTFAGIANPTVTTETLGAKMRRLMEKAQVSNPVNNAPLSGAWPWPASTAVNLGAKFSNGGNVYVVSTPGTTASSGGPTGVSTSGITDGTAVWAYFGPQTAPVVTNTTATPSGLTQTISNTDARIRYGGGNTVSSSGGYAFWDLGVGVNDTTCVSNAFPKEVGTGGFIEIETDAPKISFDFKQTDYFATVMVTDLGAGPGDTRFVDPAPFQFVASGSGHSYLNLDFTNSSVGTSRHLRRIRVDTGCNQVFFAVRVAPTDVVGPPSTADVIHAAFLTDSWGAGQNILEPSSQNTAYTTTFGLYGWRVGFDETLGRLLGWDDVWASGASGTGYVQLNANYSQPYSGRIADITSITANGVSYTPDVVVVMGGVNDSDVDIYGTSTLITTAIEQAGVLLTLQNIRAALPNAVIFVLGFNSPGTGALSLNQPYEAAMAAAVAAFNDPKTYFIPNITATDTGASGSPQGYITGTGHVGATVGNGNADFYVGTLLQPGDGHPNDIGMQYLARRYASKMKAIIQGAAW
jgi:hypothetical protein